MTGLILGYMAAFVDAEEGDAELFEYKVHLVTACIR